jgi:alpha-tubulin suppressor-like RCC1 family protein
MKKLLLIIVLLNFLNNSKINAQCWSSISAGANYSLGLKSDGTIWAWGRNYFGELGLGTNGEFNGTNNPTQIGTDNNWAKIYAGNDHSIAIKNDGTLWAWGANNSGELGDGTNISKNSPIQIGSSNDWNSIASGLGFTLALKNDGTLWAWGRNNFGQLGDGTYIDKATPVQIGTSNWQSITAGYWFSIGVKSDGTLWSWGYNINGTLGNGNIPNQNTPMQVGTDNTWQFVVSNNNYSFGIKTNGTLWGWGANGSYMLGDGTTINRTTPTQIGNNNDWVKVFAGGTGSLGIKSNGTLWGWGFNRFGVLGLGNTTPQPTPVQIGISSEWISASIDGHCLFLKIDGSLWVSGNNSDGELGDGVVDKYTSPNQTNSTNDWLSITAGTNFNTGSHSHGIKVDGTLWSWGENLFGELGDGTNIHRSTPIQIGNSNDWLKVSSGTSHSIALKTDNTLWSWGDNHRGQLGNNSNINSLIPIQIGSNDWVKVIATDNRNLAIKTDGTLWAWGENYYGQLGDGTLVDKSVPTQIGNQNDWQEIGIGNWTSFAIKSDGTLWGWGKNNYGQLGDGTFTDRLVPTKIGNQNDWESVSVGNSFAVAKKNNGTLWSWGLNGSGQLGNGTTYNGISPSNIIIVSPSSIAGTYNAIFSQFTSGNIALPLPPNEITEELVLYQDSDGSNSLACTDPINASQIQGKICIIRRGVCGFADKVLRAQNAGALAVIIVNNVEGDFVIGGGNTSLTIPAISVNQALGESLINTMETQTVTVTLRGTSLTPIQIGSESNWSKVNVGTGSVIALKTDGTLWSWGENSYGQLGLGNFGNSNSYNVPTQIENSNDWQSFEVGDRYVLAIKNDNSLWGWGTRIMGVLGDGTFVHKFSLSPITCPDSTLSISEIGENNSQIIIFPNPTSQLLYVSHSELSTLGIQVVDLNGKLMYSGTINKEEPLDVSNFNQGMYLITIENKETKKKNTYKIIKR